MWMRHGTKACLLGSTLGKANHKPHDLDLDQQTDHESHLPIIVGLPADQVLFNVVFSTLR